jgi:iron complex transport system permease protein
VSSFSTATRPGGFFLIASVALIASIVLAVGFGSMAIPASGVMRIVLAHLRNVPSDSPAAIDTIVWVIRLPRVLLAGIVGAALAIVGTALQAVTANRLADPHLLGVSSGATLGAVATTVFFGAFLGPFSVSIVAFMGALAATAMVVVLASRHGRLNADRLVLAGVAVSFVMLAAANLLLYLGDQRAASSILFWTLGGVGLARWNLLPLPAIVAFMGGSILLLRRRELNALMTSDTTAVSLGISASRLRLEVFLISAFMTGTMVAVSGAIGFVGLMAPHFCRPLVGAGHRRLLPAAALTGAILLIWADVAARTLVAPDDLPIGIVTALAGGTVFIVLMALDRRRG